MAENGRPRCREGQKERAGEIRPFEFPRCSVLLPAPQNDHQQPNYGADQPGKAGKAGTYRGDPRSNNFEALPAICAESHAKLPEGFVGK